MQAIRTCAEHLQRLVNGLRMFALDPDDSKASDVWGAASLGEWWNEVQPFLRNAVPRTTALEHDLPEDLPPPALPRHLLTQAIFNLVQNAGDAMRGRDGGGTVRVWAQASADRRTIRLGVSDDGPGMTPEVKRRCLEPFFSTKTRGLSTGLDLALVHAIVQKIGGEMQIDSEPGRGTTFILHVPTQPESRGGGGGAAGQSAACQPQAAVFLVDARVAAYVSSMLRSLGFEVKPPGASWGGGGRQAAMNAALWVTEADPQAVEAARNFVAKGGDRRVVLLGSLPEGQPRSEAIIEFSGSPKPAAIRQVLQQAAAEFAVHSRRGA